MFDEDEYGGEEDGQIEEDDIYGDLETDIFLSQSKRPKFDEVFKNEEYQRLKKENTSLKTRLKQILKENEAYATNISSLYLTAKNEIEKKNFIIKSLTEKLKGLTKSKSSLSESAAQEILRECQESFVESQTQLTIKEINNCMKKCMDNSGRKKVVRFGNMAFYAFREDGEFKRGEEVKFPEKPKTVVNKVDDFKPDSKTHFPKESPLNIEQTKVKTSNERITPPSSEPSESTKAAVKSDPSHDDDNEKSLKRKRNDEPETIKREGERNRDQSNRRHSAERYSQNHHKNSRPRDYSPALKDRQYSRKSDCDRYYNTRQKDIGNRRSDNHVRSSHTRNSLPAKYPPPRRCHYEKSYQESSRSRSRSK